MIYAKHVSTLPSFNLHMIFFFFMLVWTHVQIFVQVQHVTFVSYNNREDVIHLFILYVLKW